jgi:hypothetical protein
MYITHPSTNDLWRLAIILLSCGISTYIFVIWRRCNREYFVVEVVTEKTSIKNNTPDPVVVVDPSTNMLLNVATSLGNINNNLSKLSGDVNKMRVNQEVQQAKQDAQESERERQRQEQP